MQPTLCSKCKKNVAVVFISKLDGEKTTNEGLCLKCAKDLGLPQVDEMMKRMGISDEDLETLNSEMLQAMSGVENLEDLPSGEDGDGEEEEGKTATFPFLNRLFSGGDTPKSGESAEEGEKREVQTTGVYCVVGVKAIFKPVKVLYSGEGFALVQPAGAAKRILRSGDEVIVTARDLDAGKVVGE